MQLSGPLLPSRIDVVHLPSPQSCITVLFKKYRARELETSIGYIGLGRASYEDDQ